MKRALALVLGLVGCGEPLVGQDYLGTPTLSVRGGIEQREAGLLTNTQDSLRLSLFWIGFDARDRQTPVVEQETAVDAGIGSFSMTVFENPPDKALTFGDLANPGTDVGIALVVLYSDTNASGALNMDGRNPVTDVHDVVLGASASHLVVYARGKLADTAPLAELVGPIEAGYHLFANVDDARCNFADNVFCDGTGTLEQVPTDSPIVLSLYGDPDAVEVPNPRLPNGSGTSTGNNIYGGR